MAVGAVPVTVSEANVIPMLYGFSLTAISEDGGELPPSFTEEVSYMSLSLHVIL